MIGRAAPKAIALIWSSWLALVLLLALIHPLAPGMPSTIGEIAVISHLVVTLIVISLIFKNRIAVVLALSLVLRTALVFWDLNFRDVFLLTNSGADTEMFYYWAVEVAEDPNLLSADIRGGAFSKLFGLLFFLIGPVRVFGQYTNALFGFTAVLVIHQVLCHLPLSDRGLRRALVLAALLPNALVLSAIFLRESVIALLVTVSVFGFVRWYQTGSFRDIVVAVASILTASVFHSGVIAVGAGMVLVFLAYQPGKDHFGPGWKTIPYLFVFAAIVYLVATRYPDLFLGKFERVESGEDVIGVANSRGGASEYLTGIEVENYGDLLRYGPLRTLYFLASPLPWDFRGLADVFAFLFDSLFYLGSVVAFLVQYRRLDASQKVLGIGILVVILVSVAVFGAGVSNSGTALRHRFKLLALFITLAALAMTKFRSESSMIHQSTPTDERLLETAGTPKQGSENA